MKKQIDGWCILRTQGARTLPVMRSLVDGGFDAWTPVGVAMRRRGRNRDRVEIEAPIMPTFVFVRSHHVADLIDVLQAPSNPHPPFSIFRYLRGIPIVGEAEIASLRDAEAKVRLAGLRKQRRVFEKGQAVHLTEGGFVGLTGVVEDGDGKFALVSFGGSFRVKIATFLLHSDDVAIAPSVAE